jgi:hypothetical protein
MRMICRLLTILETDFTERLERLIKGGLARERVEPLPSKIRKKIKS